MRTDPDASVRLAILKRLDDYELWRECSTADSDDALRGKAREVYIAMLCSNAKGPTLTRRIAELETLSASEMEKVAVDANDRDLRASALSRVTRPALLSERAISDPDPALRLQLLDRIEDSAALERIAERTRKTDKIVSRRAREKVDALRIGGGNAEAIAARARALCDRVETLMRSPQAASDVELETIDREWEKLGASVPTDIANRFRGARAITQQSREARSEKPSIIEISPIAEIVDPGIVVAVDVSESLASRTRFDAALAAATARTKRDREERQARLNELENLLPEFEAAIDAGDSAQAKRLRVDIDALIAAIDDFPAAIARRVAPLQAKSAELERWLVWSNRQRRDALCAEMETLQASGLHPDAVATRVREARDEWRRLDATEGATTSEPSGIARRFQALCQRALKPTKTYFDKRDLVRKSRGEQILAMLTRADAAGSESTDWKLLATLRQELGDALRRLDDVEPQERTTFAKRIKTQIGQIATRIADHEKDVETSKQRLIERATSLVEASDRRETPRAVRDLQKQWTALGNGKRSTDQRQWRVFRAACDAAFGKLDAERVEQETKTAASRAQALEIIEQIESLASNPLENADATRTALRELSTRWQSANSSERALDQRYRQAHDAVTSHLRDAARRMRLSRYTIALQKFAELRAIDDLSVAPDIFDLSDVVVVEFKKSLFERFDRARERANLISEADDSTIEQAHDILVRLELLARIDSPLVDRQRRMDLQVKRLATRMRHGESADDERDLVALMAAWFDLDGRVGEPLHTRFDHAARAAIDNLP